MAREAILAERAAVAKQAARDRALAFALPDLASKSAAPKTE